MSDTPTQAPAASVAPQNWSLSRLATMPHRLGFFCAVFVLVIASLWWLVVQINTATGGSLGIEFAVLPMVTHGTVMVFGFMPMFFSGFLFTAGPVWLKSKRYSGHQLLGPLLLQLVGWVLWLVGSCAARGLAIAGLFLACIGLIWMFSMFWALIITGTSPDKMHGKAVGCGAVVGCLSLLGAGISLLAGQDMLELQFVVTALWGFIVVVFSSVAHRMIPYFTHNVVPSIPLWRPRWILGTLLGIAAYEVVNTWVTYFEPAPHAWAAWGWLTVVVEVVVGLVLLWLALVWGVFKSMNDHLLAMLHIGFSWFGLALVYSGVGEALALTQGTDVLGLGPLHALAMGFLGSLILAMVTRVTCGHSGRPLRADALAWGLFLLLQITVVVRLLAAVQGIPFGWTVAAALLWAIVVTFWGVRFAWWYGKPRVDGKPG